MSLDGSLSIASSGLATAQRALALLSQNIGNADTPGYTRKTLAQTAQVVGDIPLGVRAAHAERSVDAALIGQLDASRSDSAAATARETLLQGIEQAYGGVSDPGATTAATGSALTDDVAALQSAFLALRADPADTGLQRSAVGAATDVAAAFNRIGQAIGAARQQAQDGIVAEVAAIDAGLRNIGALTRQIQTAGNAGAETAGLEDQRDRALATLSASLKFSTVRQANGGLVLIAQGGQSLPLDTDRDALKTGAATAAPGAYFGPGGSLPGITLGGQDVTGQLGGGRLGTYVGLRDTTLPRFQAEADLAAATLASRLDQQGLRLFTDRSGAVPDLGQPYASGGQLGFANRIEVSAAVAAQSRLLRDGTQTVAAAPGGPTAFTPNPAGGPTGFTALLDRVLDFGLGGSPAAGASWPNIPGTGLGPDGSLASPFAALAGITDYITQVTASQTGERAAATDAKDRAGALQATLEQRFNTQSGVSIDAEMTSLIQLQNAYAANAKVVTTVQQMWDALLKTIG